VISVKDVRLLLWVPVISSLSVQSQY